MGQELPQLWDLASGHADDDVSWWPEVAAAEAADITIADRLRGLAGTRVRLCLVDGQTLHATVTEAYRDGAVVVSDRGALLVTLAGLLWITGPNRVPVPSSGSAELGVTAGARQWLDRRVHVKTLTGAAIAGTLAAVGGDHLLLADGPARTCVPLVAVATLCPT